MIDIGLLSFAGTMAGAGIGAYVAVRVELAKVGEIARAAQAAAATANQRIDSLLTAARGR